MKTETKTTRVERALKIAEFDGWDISNTDDLDYIDDIILLYSSYGLLSKIKMDILPKYDLIIENEVIRLVTKDLIFYYENRKN